MKKGDLIDWQDMGFIFRCRVVSYLRLGRWVCKILASRDATKVKFTVTHWKVGHTIFLHNLDHGITVLSAIDLLGELAA